MTTDPTGVGPASSLLHISDLHFGTERPEVMEALLELAHQGVPGLRAVLFTGDVTQRALFPEFEAARRFMQRLPEAPQIVIPGNHDISLFNLPQRLLRPYTRYDGVFGGHDDAVWSDEDWLVVSLKTTRRWRHRHGQVSPRQVQFTTDALQRARPRQVRLVLVHQPAAVPREDLRDDVLRGSGPAVRAWASAGADAVLGGHIHLPYVLPLDTGAVTGQGRQVWAVQAGTGISSRLRADAGNSVNVLHHTMEATGPVLVVERWDHADGAFRSVGRQRLVVDRA